MNTTIETLEKEIEVISNERNKLYNEFHNIFEEGIIIHFTSKFNSPWGNENIKLRIVNMKSIKFDLKGDSWSGDVSFSRDCNWDFRTTNSPKYKDVYLDSISSQTLSKEENLKYVSFMGKMCDEVLNKTEWFNKFELFMNEYSVFQENTINPLNRKIAELEKSIKNIKDLESTEKLNNILKKQEFEIDSNNEELKNRRHITLYYGTKKYDYCSTFHIRWELNKGGKTAKLYSKNYNGTHEFVLVKENVKLNYIESFIKQYSNYSK